MSPMLVTEGESAKTATHTASRQSVEGAGARGRASNDWKPAIIEFFAGDNYQNWIESVQVGGDVYEIPSKHSSPVSVG